MICLVMDIYAGLLEYYRKKWKSDRIDAQYRNWEEAQVMREEMGFDEVYKQRIPKRKIKNNAARKKHGL